MIFGPIETVFFTLINSRIEAGHNPLSALILEVLCRHGYNVVVMTDLLDHVTVMSKMKQSVALFDASDEEGINWWLSRAKTKQHGVPRWANQLATEHCVIVGGECVASPAARIAAARQIGTTFSVSR